MKKFDEIVYNDDRAEIMLDGEVVEIVYMNELLSDWLTKNGWVEE